RKLLATAICESKAWPGFCRLELDVVPSNEPAIHLYDSMGFVREGTKRKAAKYHGKPVDLILMALVW
ncbi:MAG: GNAT family N-acetyltransferase, partial [Proteobacteria bacterium]|nr:GNAT family N-acetyltransferase [Pseudomonadota bacterium]